MTTNSAVINGSRGSSQTEKLCEMHARLMTKVIVGDETEKTEQKTQTTSGSKEAK